MRREFAGKYKRTGLMLNLSKDSTFQSVAIMTMATQF